MAMIKNKMKRGEIIYCTVRNITASTAYLKSKSESKMDKKTANNKALVSLNILHIHIHTYIHAETTTHKKALMKNWGSK